MDIDQIKAFLNKNINILKDNKILNNEYIESDYMTLVSDLFACLSIVKTSWVKQHKSLMVPKLMLVSSIGFITNNSKNETFVSIVDNIYNKNETKYNDFHNKLIDIIPNDVNDCDNVFLNNLDIIINYVLYLTNDIILNYKL